MFGSSFARISAVILALFILAFAAAAQDLDDVTISGKVTDSNGLAVVGASVTASSIEMGIDRTVITGEDGRYQIVKLKPGTYTVKVTAAGFGVQETPAIPTISAQNVQRDFTLAPAGVTAEQTVTVTEDDAPVIDTTRVIVGGTVTEREVQEIPNNSRDALDLVLTLGGTSEEALSVRDLAEDRNAANRLAPTEQGNFSLSGGSSYSNNITIDGLDNNDDRAATDRFQPSLEAIAEVQVINNQFSAEYGRASGGRVNLRTSSGGNKFRGRAFMFFRDDNLNANTYYNKRTLSSIVYDSPTNSFVTRVTRSPLERAAYSEYVPGFTLSGPVILPFGEGKSIYDGHNRTFFSVAYENLNLLDTTLINTYVPVAVNPRFLFPASTGGSAVCENVNSTSTSTCANGGAGLMLPYTKVVATPNMRHTFTGRIDHQLSTNNNLTVGLQLGRKRNQKQNIAFTTKLEEALQGTSADTEAYNITDNHVFSAKVVNQFRFQYSTYRPSYETKSPDDPVVLVTYNDPTTATSTGRTLIAGNSSASLSASGIFASKRQEDRVQFQDSLTFLVGRHTFKGGFDFQRVNSENLDPTDSTGTYNFGNSGTGTTTVNYTGPCTPAPCSPATVTYLGVKNYELNQVTRFRQNFGRGATVKNTYVGFFFNDETKLKSNLTLNLGIRYERESVLSDHDNWGPRVGVAWDPFKKGKGVIRLGAGIFYNRVLLRTIDDFIASGQQDLFDTANLSNSNLRLAVGRAFSNIFPTKFKSADELRAFINPVLIANGGSAGMGFTSFDGALTRLVNTDTLKIPESYQFNVGFEREIRKGWVFEANYTWNKIVHLWGESNPNAPNLGIANARLGRSFESWTDYLLTVNAATAGVGNYRFVLGPTTDAVGISQSTTGTGCSAATPCTVVNLNTTNPSTAAAAPLAVALRTVDQFRPLYPNLNQQKLIASDRKSFYQGLILELRQRYSRFGYGFGGSFRAAYTLSKLMDDGLNNTSDAEANGDFGREWSRALQDRRHRFALTATFETPRWLGKLKFSPRFRYGSPAPFSIGYSGLDRNLDDVANDRPNFTGDTSDIIWRRPDSPVPTQLLSQFSLPPIGSKGGDLPRNAGNGPSLYTFDLSITREFKVGERVRFRPVAEIGNVFNWTVLSFGSGFIDYSTFGVTNANQASRLTFERDFLVPGRAYRPRDVRFGLRVDF